MNTFANSYNFLVLISFNFSNVNQLTAKGFPGFTGSFTEETYMEEILKIPYENRTLHGIQNCTLAKQLDEVKFKLKTLINFLCDIKKIN